MWFCGLHLLPYLVSTFKRVAAGLGGIIELCQDINYNQKQLFCAPETLSTPSWFPLPSVAPSRPFLILCKLYYFHCLFTRLPILYPSAQDLRRLSGFCRVSPFLSRHRIKIISRNAISSENFVFRLISIRRCFATSSFTTFIMLSFLTSLQYTCYINII